MYGEVTSSPAGVAAGGLSECFRTCSAQFDPNTTVTLTATPIRHGAKFKDWSGAGAGGCGTEPTCVVNTGEADTAVTANFEVATVNVTVTKTGTGSGTVAHIGADEGLECGATCSRVFEEGFELGLEGDSRSGVGVRGLVWWWLLRLE